MSELTSIIMTCYDHTQAARNTSMAAVVAITRFTDPKEYELIVVDCDPMDIHPFNYSPKISKGTTPVKIDEFIEVKPDLGYYAAMNIGAGKAKGKYLCFIENDVFVTPNWLPNLRWYLENGDVGAVFPKQAPDTYENTKKYDDMPFKEAINGGCEEQGLMLIDRIYFDKVGGWDKNIPMAIGWKRFLQQMQEKHISFGSTTKSTIIHICGMTYWNSMAFEQEKFEKNTDTESKYINEYLPSLKK